ncbi:hypothetical protein BAY59_10960 [Prauserella coralliicola]|nr:hypothetical protein BAY59_10960 [Prauserella coralliicola]
MSLTTEQLDELCGGTPRHSRKCPIEACRREVGPYYSAAAAHAALAEHVRLGHLRKAAEVGVRD